MLRTAIPLPTGLRVMVERIRALVRSLWGRLPELAEVEAGEVRDGLREALAKLDPGLPAQHGPGEGQVRAALLRIVARQGQLHDLALGIRELDAELRQLADGELVGVADVDGPRVRGVVHHPYEALDLVLHEAEGPRLGPVPVNCDVLPGQGLHDEVRDDAAVVGVHPRAVGVEDAGAAGVDTLAVILEDEGLCHALALVVARAYANGVDVAPVALRLRRDRGVAIALRGGGLEKPGEAPLGEPKLVVGAHEGRLDGLDRVELVVRRGGRAGQVVDLVHLDLEGLDDVMADDLEVGPPHQVLDVELAAREVVVEADHVVPLVHEAPAEVRAQEAGPSRHEDAEVGRPQAGLRDQGGLRLAGLVVRVRGRHGCGAWKTERRAGRGDLAGCE
mmetsp:Transcript_30203/g.89559  ORF Transcript_30203/g.89559 Transcript_30203/m.89559 type:complete len:390 (+) Transcript_30203:56-1225(+)